MNKRITELRKQAEEYAMAVHDGRVLPAHGKPIFNFFEVCDEKFAKLLIEAVLDQVKERAYYTGDRDWSDEVDRPWIQLEFGYGPLHDAKRLGVEE